MHVISSLIVSVLRPLLFKLIVMYCPTRHSHWSSLIHVLASSNLIVVCISLCSPPLRRCPSSLPRIWSSCNIILVIHLCLVDNLSRLIKLDSRVYFLIHLCPWWYRHLLINDIRPLPLEFDCRVYLTGHSFPLRWYMSSPLRIWICVSLLIYLRRALRHYPDTQSILKTSERIWWLNMHLWWRRWVLLGLVRRGHDVPLEGLMM